MDSFLTACGATAPLTLEIEGPGLSVPERRVFNQPFVLVGRDDRADLVLDHDAVSRRHAYLQVVEGRVFFIDLDSRAGTSAGESQAETGWLVPGQGIEIGAYTLRHVPFPGLPPEAPPPSNPLLARSPSGSSDLPRVTLEFQSRSAGHSVWRMSQVLALVGSAPRCKVRLFDSQVSKLHCALLRTPRGLWVVDLLSRGGITVNGVATRGGPLNPGDFLGLGQVVVRPSFEDGPRPEAPAAPAVWPAREPAAGWSGRGEPTPLTPVPTPGPGLPPMPPGPPGLGGMAIGELASKEPALALLLSHFGQMQQQMMDQFQQSMMMMLQMFGGMHREQMGLVREELERLRELNDEIAAIKVEMAQRPGPMTGARSIPPPMPPSAQPGGGQSPAFDAHGRPLPPNGGRLPAWPNVPPWSAPTARPPRGHTPDAPPFRPPTAPQGPRTPPEPTAPPGDPSADVHDWLNDRLNAITAEQQNRWQKIMTMIRGAK